MRVRMRSLSQHRGLIELFVLVTHLTHDDTFVCSSTLAVVPNGGPFVMGGFHKQHLQLFRAVIKAKSAC